MCPKQKIFTKTQKTPNNFCVRSLTLHIFSHIIENFFFVCRKSYNMINEYIDQFQRFNENNKTEWFRSVNKWWWSVLYCISVIQLRKTCQLKNKVCKERENAHTLMHRNTPTPLPQYMGVPPVNRNTLQKYMNLALEKRGFMHVRRVSPPDEHLQSTQAH